MPLKKSEHQVLCKPRSKMDNIMRSFQTFSLERNQRRKRNNSTVCSNREKGKIVMKMTMGNRNSDKGGLLIFFKHFKYAIFTLFYEKYTIIWNTLILHL